MRAWYVISNLLHPIRDTNAAQAWRRANPDDPLLPEEREQHVDSGEITRAEADDPSLNPAAVELLVRCRGILVNIPCPLSLRIR